MLCVDVCNVNPFFRGREQHDAAELIRCVLDTAHDALKRTLNYDWNKLAVEARISGSGVVPPTPITPPTPVAASTPTAAAATPTDDKKKSDTKTDAKAPAAPKLPRFEHSIVSDLFRGRFLSEVKCSNCKKYGPVLPASPPTLPSLPPDFVLILTNPCVDRDLGSEFLRPSKISMTYRLSFQTTRHSNVSRTSVVVSRPVSDPERPHRKSVGSVRF